MKKNRAFWRRAGAIVTIGVAVAIWRYEAATPAEAASSGTPAAMAGTQPVAADAFGTGATTPGPKSGGSMSTRCAAAPRGAPMRMPK